MFQHHEIKIEDSRDFVISTVLASNSNEHKVLSVLVIPYTQTMRYEVTHRKTRIAYSGNNLQDAIDAYNEIYESNGTTRTKITKVLEPVIDDTKPITIKR